MPVVNTYSATAQCVLPTALVVTLYL